VVNSDTKITAVAPSQAAATVNVTVTTAAGTSATGAGNQFTYNAASAPSLSSLSPSGTKTVATGGQIRITGSNLLGATSVSCGGTSVSFTVFSDTTVIATVPTHTPGSVSVTVTTPSGTSSGLTFTYSANSPPVANPDMYSVGAGGTLTVSAASGVLSNDT